jgi:hypothetical protein
MRTTSFVFHHVNLFSLLTGKRKRRGREGWKSRRYLLFSLNLLFRHTFFGLFFLVLEDHLSVQIIGISRKNEEGRRRGAGRGRGRGRGGEQGGRGAGGQGTGEVKATYMTDWESNCRA